MGIFDPKWKTVNIKKENQAIASLQKITDQNLLKTIAFEAPLDSVAAAAVNRITDSGILQQIALNAKVVPAEAAIEKTSDAALLKRIALEYEDDRYATAVDRISDQQCLKEIVLNAKALYSKVRAAKRLQDTGIAHELAQKDLDWIVIYSLIPHIDDQRLLKEKNL